MSGGALELIVPTPAAVADRSDPLIGVTNRIVFVAPVGTGPTVARALSGAIDGRWDALKGDAFRGNASLPATPGMPDVAWVCVTGEEQEYPRLWERAQTVLRQRRRARVFEPEQWNNVPLCAQSTGMPAATVVPKNAPAPDREERFSAAGWTKRRAGRVSGRFPSTTVIASSIFRARLIDAARDNLEVADELAALVHELNAVTVQLDRGDAVSARHTALRGIAVPPDLAALSTRLGTRISGDAWEAEELRAEFGEVDDAVRRSGRKIAGRIARFAEKLRLPALTPYFAIVIQDLDRLGTTMAALSRSEQVAASDTLTGLGRAQLAVSADPRYLGIPVYAGGDDFVAFAPAATALGLAAAVRISTRDGLRGSALAQVTASTAVVFAHMTAPLQLSIATAQTALARAKEAIGPNGLSRDALTVVVLRRGGERARTIQPWRVDSDGLDAAQLLERIAPDAAAESLSARLAARLERDREEFDALADRDLLTLHREVSRLVARQGGSVEVADAVIELGSEERSRDLIFDAAPAALVGRFLAGECR
jgi:CRISPR-associated protein Cmr2